MSYSLSGLGTKAEIVKEISELKDPCYEHWGDNHKEKIEHERKFNRAKLNLLQEINSMDFEDHWQLGWSLSGHGGEHSNSANYHVGISNYNLQLMKEV